MSKQHEKIVTVPDELIMDKIYLIRDQKVMLDEDFNMQIMRIYTRIRELLLTHKDILLLVEKVEKKLIKQDQKIEVLFTYLNKFIEKEDKPRKSIGYKTYPEKE